MKDETSKDIRRRRLTQSMLNSQKTGKPVHLWTDIETNDSADWAQGYRTVAQFMTTDLFTVHPEDLIDLAASVMDWRHIRHVPVEDSEGKLVGLVTHRMLLRLLANGGYEREPIAVREIMLSNPITVSPSTTSLEAIEVMRNHGIGCIPVVENDHLVGIITSYDFLVASAQLFQQHMAV
jgi:CBS domain-containing protein